MDIQDILRHPTNWKILAGTLLFLETVLFFGQGVILNFFDGYLTLDLLSIFLEMASLNIAIALILLAVIYFLKKKVRFRDKSLLHFSAAIFGILMLVILISFFGAVMFQYNVKVNTVDSSWHDPIIIPLLVEKNLWITLTNSLKISELNTAELEIPLYQLYIKQSDIDKLNENLPYSGFEFVSGNVDINNNIYETKVRYRGDNIYHWGNIKNSWRIKLKDKELYESSNKLNFINQKYGNQMVFPLTSWLAESFNILSPRSYPFALYLNGKYTGLYTYYDQIDETFLRMKNELPGDIYFGDEISSFKNDYTSSYVFENTDYWEIDASFDNDEKLAKQRLGKLVGAVQGDDLAFYDFFQKHIGEEYLKFIAFRTILADDHIDDKHNHKIYFDPSSGKYIPIVWDLKILEFNEINGLDLLTNPIDRKIIQFPDLVQKKNEWLYEFIQKVSKEEVINFIDGTADKISLPLQQDIHKTIIYYPLTMNINFSDWEEEVIILKETLGYNYDYIENKLGESDVKIYVDLDMEKIIIDVNGISAVEFKQGEQCLLVESAINPGTHCLGSGISNTLYPGRLIQDSTVENKRRTFDVTTIVSEPIRYEFQLKSNMPKEQLIEYLEHIRIVNATTEQKIEQEIILIRGGLPQIKDTNSFHPFLLIEKETSKEIIWSEKVILNENYILSKGNTLRIEPGTKVLLGENVSIISYGKISAIGTKEEPITFTSSTNVPWGVIALQGKEAKSEFSWVNISEGSGTTYDLVEYTGMLSAYNADLILENCELKNNHFFDDMLNVKKANATINNCVFLDAEKDSVDFDIASGSIMNSKFINSGNDAIDLMTSNLYMENITISNAIDKGISIGERSNPTIINFTIQDSNVGIAIKDLSDPQIELGIIKNTNIGIEVYQKNWRYGGGGLGTITNTELLNNMENFKVDADSLLKIINGNETTYCSAENC